MQSYFPPPVLLLRRLLLLETAVLLSLRRRYRLVETSYTRYVVCHAITGPPLWHVKNDTIIYCNFVA